MRAIYQNWAVLLHKNLFRKTLVRYVAVWLVQIRTYKNADNKRTNIFMQKKKRINTDKSGRKTETCVNPPYMGFAIVFLDVKQSLKVLLNRSIVNRISSNAFIYDFYVQHLIG